MRQRLALSGALLGDPPYVILDEPFSMSRPTGLDPARIAWLRRLLRLWAEEGRTVLWALQPQVAMVERHGRW
jgi:ABC-2 type transport system ATP-binding protein